MLENQYLVFYNFLWKLRKLSLLRFLLKNDEEVNENLSLFVCYNETSLVGTPKRNESTYGY